MTEEIRTYRIEVDMKTDKRVMHSRGFRAFHTDFISNNSANGYQVTYDDTPDPIDPNDERSKILNEKLKDDTLTFSELKELMRLS